MTKEEYEDAIEALDSRINSFTTWNDRAEYLQSEYDKLIADYNAKYNNH